MPLYKKKSDKKYTKKSKKKSVKKSKKKSIKKVQKKRGGGDDEKAVDLPQQDDYCINLLWWSDDCKLKPNEEDIKK